MKRFSLVWLCLLSLFAVTGGSDPAEAAVVYWTNWSWASEDEADSTGDATGAIAFPTGTVTVVYSGGAIGGSNSSWLPAEALVTADVVGNARLGTDNIVLEGGNGLTYTIVFNAPVVDPIVAVMSLGGLGITSDSTTYPSTPFAILNSGVKDDFGENPNLRSAGALYGLAGDGEDVLTASDAEDDDTGDAEEPASAPLPAGLLLAGPALAALALMRGRFKK